MITFKEFLVEKINYDWKQQLVIQLWGAQLYLSYDEMPSGPGNIESIKVDALEFLDMDKNDDDSFELVRLVC